MTTATETSNDPNVQSVDDFERSGLEIQEGVFRFRLAGSYGLMETNSGKKYLNARFVADQQAKYDPQSGQFLEIVDLKRTPSTFIKFFIETPFGTQRLNSWLSAVDYETEGVFNPATKRYGFHKDAALAATMDRTAWVRVYHKNNETYGWQLETTDFVKKPQGRIKVNGSAE